MFSKKYISQSEALKLILDNIEGALPGESVSIELCLARTTATDIYSPEDLPGFARSSVDGFAVRSSDTYGAKETMPAYITLTGEVLMGVMPDLEVKAGDTAKIPTGGMLPSGADSVVMIENAQVVSASMIEVLKPVSFGENVIRPDDDIKKGALVFRKGHRIRPQDMGALAGIGIAAVDAARKPVVSVISTGDEIVPPGSNVEPGRIRDINSITLSGLISEQGGIPLIKGIFRDDYETIKQAMVSAVKESDIVLIIGGTSVGARDMTESIIAEGKDGRILFHGVAISPGRPLIGGIVGSRPVFGLPGHPAAVAVCFDLFIRPLIGKMLGIDNSRIFRKTITASMAKGVASAAGRQDHIRVRVWTGDNGYVATPVMGKSGLITTLAAADGVVVISENRLGLDQGEMVTVNLF
jgi:molybdopterin molybdotransferase